MPKRIYEKSKLLLPDNTPRWTIVRPANPIEQDLWGWKQDEVGRWYRDIPDGKDVFDLPPDHDLVRLELVKNKDGIEIRDIVDHRPQSS